MAYTIKNDADARSVAHHLQVAALRYHEHAKSGMQPRVCEQFARQAEECERISADITAALG